MTNRKIQYMWNVILLSLSVLLLLSYSATSLGDMIYTIGNSLTWDTLPGMLEGEVEWHVDCSKSLQYIHDYPDDPCVDTSRIWTDALINTQYDWITVQPFPTTTLEQDVAVISEWMQLQPSANIVLHTGWASSMSFYAIYHGGNPDNEMTWSPEYFMALEDALEAAHPGRDLQSTFAIDILDLIYQDIGNGTAPYSSFDELYRDPIHMSYTDGRYLAHNIMRKALDQPFIDVEFDGVTASNKVYLLSKIQAITEACFAADFDGDGDVDGNDFLVWQRFESSNPLSTEDLATWQAQFGTTGTPSLLTTIPEPSSIVLLIIFGSITLARFRMWRNAFF